MRLHSRTLLRTVALVVASCTLAGCASTEARRIPSRSPNAQGPGDVLPPDLDVAVWLDIARLRGLWSLHSDRQIATVLIEYGLLSSPTDLPDAAFWLQLIKQSDRWWLGCRPTADGCTDTVVFARGNFPAKSEPVLALGGVAKPLDLGAGWFRASRQHRVGRRGIARVYFAPPDRYIAVAPAEIDAVERSLERGQQDGRSLVIEERGLISISIRAPALARQLERRAPSAARLLRDAITIGISLELQAHQLLLTATVRFQTAEQAERTRAALALITKTLGMDRNPERALTSHVVGSDLTLQLRIDTPASNGSQREQPPPPARDEPAAQ